MKVNVVNFESQKVEKEVSLDPEIFGLEVRASILHRMVNWQLAKRRAGTHKTKQRGEVSGTTKKAFKQKGTGNARRGNNKAPHLRGGGVAFGPVVRSHFHSLTKKFRKLALKIALSSKLNDDDLIIVDNAQMVDVKTSSLSKIFESHGFKSALIIDSEVNDNFKKSASNLIGFDVLPEVGINVYDILKHKKLVLTENALKSLNERFKK